MTVLTRRVPGRRRAALVAALAAGALLAPAAPASARTEVIRERSSRAVVTVESVVDRPFGPGCSRTQDIQAFRDEDEAFVSYSDFSECDGDGRLVFDAVGPAEVIEIAGTRRARLVATLPVVDGFGGGTVGTVRLDLTLTGTGAVTRTRTHRDEEVPGEGGTVVRVTLRDVLETRSATVSGTVVTDYEDWVTVSSTSTGELRSQTLRRLVRTS